MYQPCGGGYKNNTIPLYLLRIVKDDQKGLSEVFWEDPLLYSLLQKDKIQRWI